MAEPRNPFRDSRNDYFRALGEFIHAFAETEAQLLYALWYETGVSPETARAVFSGVRIDQAKDLINRVLDSQGRKRFPGMTAAFTHLGELTRARNDIVHYGTRFEGGDTHVTNAMAAHVPEKLRIRPVSVAILDDMTSDLRRVKMIIGLSIAAKTPQAEVSSNLEATLNEAGKQPWRYKPPPQSPQPKEPRARPPRQKSPPDASRP